MSTLLFSFRLNAIHSQNQRGKNADYDVITFQVLKNNQVTGQGGITTVVSSGMTITTAPPPNDLFFPPFKPTYKDRMNDQWIIGPIEIGANDHINVVYSATNIGDPGLGNDEIKTDKIIEKLLDIYYQALLSEVTIEVAGTIGAVTDIAAGIFGASKDVAGNFSDTLKNIANAIENPVETFLGEPDNGICNGVVFAGSMSFTGAGLNQLIYSPPSLQHWAPDICRGEHEFSVHLTDASNHNTDKCGHIAETDIFFSVLTFPLSTKFVGKSKQNINDLPLETTTTHSLKEGNNFNKPGNSLKNKKTPF
ncbi:MAG: hypothetical protein D0530_07165 [Methylococcales bacterium]|jgi:hypothetical protein|nr:MAG: hypothetical protein D0530_07165 [Methylococcales bacterium]